MTAVPLKLARFEERFGILVHEDTESSWEIRWPIKYLPDSVNLGDTVTIQLFTKKQEDEEKYARMRRLLEELIN